MAGILVSDCDGGIAEVCRTFVDKVLAGKHKVLAACGGQRTLDAVASGQFDLLIITSWHDVAILYGDGTPIEQLARHFPGMSIMVWSSYPLADYELIMPQLLAWGARAYVKKPVRAVDLREAIPYALEPAGSGSLRIWWY